MDESGTVVLAPYHRVKKSLNNIFGLTIGISNPPRCLLFYKPLSHHHHPPPPPLIRPSIMQSSEILSYSSPIKTKKYSPPRPSHPHPYPTHRKQHVYVKEEGRGLFPCILKKRIVSVGEACNGPVYVTYGCVESMLEISERK